MAIPLLTSISLVVSLVTFGVIGASTWPAPVSAQSGPGTYDTPTIVITSFSCPDDIAFGDDLATNCDQPRPGRSFTVDGPATASGTTDDDGTVAFERLVPGTYDVTDESIGTDTATLVECRGVQGFGGFVNLTTGNGSGGTFSADLTNSSGKVGLVDRCTVYVLPDGWADGAVAGLAVDAAVSPDGNGLGMAIVPPDGSRSPLSGAGPADPARIDVDYALDGGDLARTLTFSTTADAADDFGTEAGYGPILLPPGDYTLTDTTRSQDNVLTLVAGGVTHAVSVGPDDSGEGATAPDSTTTNFLGSALAGAWTELDTTFYGDEAAAMYGSDSGYATGTLTFDAGGLDPAADTTLSLLGLDDELAASNRIVVTLNGTELYRGDDTFPAWDPAATGNQWEYLDIDVPAGLLQSTGNELSITNLSQGSSVGQPPWVMITALTFDQGD